MVSICQVCTKQFIPTKNSKGLFCSPSCSSRSRVNVHRLEAVTLYAASPVLCKNCETPLTYDQHRLGGSFCSRSCGVTHNNLAKIPDGRKCIQCSLQIVGNGKYCSAMCRKIQLYKTNTLTKFNAGLATDRRLIRKVLIREHGHRCQQCSETLWRGLPIPLEVHHCDGNAANNTPENVVLWCPNCHAQDPTSRGANRGNGRRSRGLPTR